MKHIFLSLATAVFALLSPSTFSLSAQKINGMSFSGPNNVGLNIEMFENIKLSNSNWIALVPEALLDRSTLSLGDNKAYWGGTIEANTQAILLAKEVGFKICLKPHIVLPKQSKSPSESIDSIDNQRSNKKTDRTKGAEWRGAINFKNESDWDILERNYEAYIIELAEIAEEHEVELFAIGTELKKFTKNRSHFWEQLIKKVRTIYSGKVTYAANWDEYDNITFWDELDYIGVDSYFPINKSETPETNQTIKNWEKIAKKLEELSVTYDKKILLTEFGYRNVSYAGKHPWTHDDGESNSNNLAQENLYKAFFQTFWKESWIAGGFSWKWFAIPLDDQNTTFSIQGKPTIKIVQKWYSK